MDTNEPGREPTDAELICNYYAAANKDLFVFDHSTRSERELAVGLLIDRGAAYSTGQRPMPGSEVSRAEVLKASTDTLLNAEAERLPDTPAPDEVAQLRAEVVEQSATINRQYELLKGVANVLKGQAGETELWSHADLPEMATRLKARVAELEAVKRAADNMAYAALFVIGNQGNEANAIDGLEIARDKYMAVSAPGKEPTSA